VLHRLAVGHRRIDNLRACTTGQHRPAGANNRRSLESHGDVAGVPATLRRGHVYDQAPVEGLERQKRSDERTVVASHVKDVAPENGSTTSRHAERNDVVDALRALQSIGVMRMIVSESNVVVMTGDHPACRRIQIGADP